MRVRAIGLISVLSLTAFPVGCGGSGDGSNADQIESFSELEAVLKADLEAEIESKAAGDTLDFLPGRTQIAFGDLPAIQDRGFIRILVSPSRTNYFSDGGRERGFEYELMREYEKWLKSKRRRRWIMLFLPVPFDRLLPELKAGRGDIAAAGITITPERLDSVSFADPYFTNVKEIMVGRKDGVRLDSLPDLAGHTVHVVRGSSYQQHILELNEEFEANGHDRIKLERAPQYLEAEDLLEFVDDGLIDFTVVDKHVAELWSSTLPNIELYDDIPIHEGGQIAWAVRTEDTKLRDDLSAFVRNHKKGSRLGNIIFNRYYDDTKWLSGPSTGDQERLDEMRMLVQKYAEQYDFDWLLLAAIAYQESKLDQSVRSRAGAVGLFQIKPAIAAAKPIGIDNVYELENNIHAGIRYLAHIRDHYLDDPGLTDVVRTDLMMASYNTGPSRIRKFRRQAPSKGYDPNKWFGEIERMAGRETIGYVANINRHYYALRLGLHAREEKAAAKANR
jgi:membrane-bound lytic murein transglycosylase MltF